MQPASYYDEVKATKRYETLESVNESRSENYDAVELQMAIS